MVDEAPMAEATGKVNSRNPVVGSPEESDGNIVCAGQRIDQEGSSPSGSRMEGVISKSGGNASLAPTGVGEDRVSTVRWDLKGLRRSAGPQSKRRTGRPKTGQGRACTMGAKAFPSTRRTKVCAGGTVRKIDV